MFRGICCFLLVLGMLVATAGAEGDQAVTITIFHTNDLQERYEEGEPGIGLARIATLVKLVDNAVLFDAGDSLGVHDQDLRAIRIMNATGYSAMVPGDRDLSFGYERLQELARIADFELVCANLRREGELILPPFSIVAVGGMRLGVFGLTTPEVGSVAPDLVIDDTVVAARRMVTLLEGIGVDLVIALAHLGQGGNSAETSTRVAQEVAGIDIIIDGHSQHPWEDVQSVGNTLIVMANKDCLELGRIDITFGAHARFVSVSVVRKGDLDHLDPDPGVLAVLAGVRAGVIGNRDDCVPGIKVGRE